MNHSIRRALLKWASARGMSDLTLWTAYAENEGYGSIRDALETAEQRYGLATGSLAQNHIDLLEQEARAHHESTGSLTVEPSAQQQQAVYQRYAIEFALMLLPDEEFLTVLERAPALPRVRRRPSESLLDYAGEIFRTRGVPWSASQTDGITWHGDPAAASLTLLPALKALQASRLAGPLSEFEDALHKRRSGDAKSLEDAIEEAAKSVESLLQVLIGAHGLTAPSNKTVRALFGVLSTPKVPSAVAVLPGYLDSLVYAAAGPRNHMASHGAGSTPRQVPAELADAALGAAATAIGLLVHYLP